jgi:hypothetical protein
MAYVVLLSEQAKTEVAAIKKSGDKLKQKEPKKQDYRKIFWC